MRVAVITREKPGVSETFINNHVTKLGYDVTLIYGGSNPHKSDSVRKSILVDTIYRIIRMALFLWRDSIDRFYWSYSLKRVLRKRKIDVALVEYLNIGANVFMSLRKARVPMICTCLGYEISRYDILEKYSVRYSEMFAYCSKVIAVSNHMRAPLESLGLESSRIVYSPAGPDHSFFAIESNPSESIVVAVGRFVEKKAPHLTILAFYRALGKVPKAKLVVAGDGPLKNFCIDLVKGLGISDKVSFPGNINQDEQRNLMETCSVFIQHSRRAENGDMEGTPVAILEASAAGVPVISTFHAGISEIVIHGETGLLSEEGDVYGMADNLSELLQKKHLAKEMGTNGKRYVYENFSLQAHVEILRNELSALK